MPQQNFDDQPAYKQLSREIIQVVSLKRLLINVVGMLTVVFLFNLIAIVYFQNDIQNRGDYIVREKWRMVNTLDEPADWLVLGDSSANQGIDTAILNEELGDRSINLALNASWGIVGDAWMLESYIERFGPPENVIIGHVHDAYWREIELATLTQSPLPWRAWEFFNPPIELTVDEEIKTVISRYFPLYHREGTLRQVIKLLFEAPEEIFNQRSYTLNPDGYMPTSNANPHAVIEDAEIQKVTVSNRDWGNFTSSINQEAIDRIIELAEQHQINVYFVNSPLYDKLYQDKVFQEYIHQMRDWLSETTAQSPYAHYIDRFYLFKADELRTVDHTYDVSARKYTRQIVAEIKRLTTPEGTVID